MQRSTQVFCGVRMLCAKCHAHPFENWTQDDYFGLYNFFNQVTPKNDPRQMGVDRTPRPCWSIYAAGLERIRAPACRSRRDILGGEEPKLATDVDRRDAYAQWLTSRENPFFARSMTNRIWSYFFHRGIIDPVDDLRSTNPPINPELLDALTKDFVDARLRRAASDADDRHLADVSAQQPDQRQQRARRRQLLALPCRGAWRPSRCSTAWCKRPACPRRSPARRPASRPASLPDANIQSEFLKLFGKPQRMEACECERDTGSNMLQALYFINGDSILGRIGSPQQPHREARAARKGRRSRWSSSFTSGRSAASRPIEELKIGSPGVLAELRRTNGSKRRKTLPGPC